MYSVCVFTGHRLPKKQGFLDLVTGEKQSGNGTHRWRDEAKTVVYAPVARAGRIHSAPPRLQRKGGRVLPGSVWSATALQHCGLPLATAKASNRFTKT